MIIVENDSNEILCCGPAPETTGTLTVDDGVVEYMCSGARCAAWRWADVPNPEFQKLQRNETVLYLASIAPPSIVKSETHGYCGLAGRP